MDTVFKLRPRLIFDNAFRIFRIFAYFEISVNAAILLTLGLLIVYFNLWKGLALNMASDTIKQLGFELDFRVL